MALAKTDLGQQVFKDRSMPLTPRQRAVLILCDGKRSEKDLLLATASTGVTREDVQHLRELGLVAVVAAAAAPAPGPAAPAQSSGGRYLEAYEVAIRLTSGLGLKGVRLNMAVEAAADFAALVALAPRIREAVGAEKYAALEAVIAPR
jgi:hypothetical protein